jgi:energy-converting hydrogenase Eha subunit F
MIYSQLLSPLFAVGLLVEGETKKGQAFDDRPYDKTLLWAKTLRFPFDPGGVAPTRH